MDFSKLQTNDRFTIPFKVIGEKIDHHGYRTVYAEGQWNEFIVEIRLEKKVR